MKENQVIKIDGLTLIYKENMSISEWLDTRMDGVGGSDIGVILGVNPWMCATRLFFEKLKMSEPKNLNANDSVHWGRLYEDIILDQSQYWDKSDPNGYMVNYWEKKHRTASHVDFPFFIINDTFPWLRLNVDGLGFYDTSVTKESVVESIFSGVLPRIDKVIEIKRINERATERWALGYPPAYWYQVQAYLSSLLGQEVEYGEIYSQVGGNLLTHHHVGIDMKSIELLIEETYKFWQRVEAGYEILDSGLSEEETEAELWQIAPPASGIYDYYLFLSERELDKINMEQNKVTGNDEMLEVALLYKKATADYNKANAEKQKYRNLLMDYMVRNNTRIIDFGSEGTVKFNKRIYVNIK